MAEPAPEQPEGKEQAEQKTKEAEAPKPPSPAKELSDLKEQAEQKAKEVDALKARIAELTKTVGDLEKKEKEFEKAAASVEQQKKDLQCFITTRKPRLEQTVAKEAITALKNAATRKLDDLSGLVGTAEAQIVQRTAALDAAKATTVAKQAKFAEVAAIPDSNNQILKDLLALRTDAEKEDTANNLGRMYFLLLLMEDRIPRPAEPGKETEASYTSALKIIAPAEYIKQLNDAGTALTAASQAEREAKDALDQATATLKQAQKDLQDQRAKWRKETLDKIDPGPVGAKPASEKCA